MAQTQTQVTSDSISVSISSDRKFVAMSFENSVKVWDTASHHVEMTLNGHIVISCILFCISSDSDNSFNCFRIR